MTGSCEWTSSVFESCSQVLFQRAFSGGVNSDTYRGRGGGSGSFRGRSAPPRGRGRGRGDGYSRSMSQTDDGTGPPYSRGSSRDYTRRESWDDRGGFGRGKFKIYNFEPTLSTYWLRMNIYNHNSLNVARLIGNALKNRSLQCNLLVAHKISFLC